MAFDLDDLDPRNARKAKPLNLDDLNIEDLRDYVEVLKAEIVRVEAKLKAKQSHASAAASFFKK
ncbi:MAG: DUF1192 domain-containing protein [Proteobacteria bacterium]|nr:DUF1192 domain-containing protein [Pseudomonadota bacterium]